MSPPHLATPDDDRPPAWRRYLRFWRSDLRADVADELRFHLESAMAEYRAAGMSPEAAAAEARRRFGDIDGITRTLHTLSHERERTMQRRDWLDALRQDVRIAVRHLRKNPGFTLVVVLTLALGLGANSAIFSVVHSVLVRPLPFRHPERLIHLREGNGPEVVNGMAVTFGNFGAWTQRARAFDAFAGWVSGGLALTGAGEPQQLRITRATGGYFRALYIPPALGRYFDENDAALGAPKVVVLSYGLWQSAFGGDSGVVGRSVTLGAEPYVVRGVAAPEYALTPQATAAWIPFALTQEMLADHSDHEMSVVGSVREGVTNEQAIADLSRVQQELKAEHPRANFDGRIIARPYLEFLVGAEAKVLRVLFAAVTLVLLIACVNIANLLLARAAARQKEIAVRGALGAGRGRIIAQLLVESLVLAGSGAVVGLGVAAAGMKFIVHNGPPTLPRLHEVSLDGTVVAFTIVIATISGIMFGLLPALRASRLDLQSTLRQSGRTDSGSARQPLRSALVVLQVSIALVLLVSAGLLVRSAMLLQRVPPGFDPTNVFVGGLSLPDGRYPSDTLVATRFDEIVSAVSAVPGVTSAGLVSRIPIGGFGADCSVRRAGEVDGSNGGATGAHFRTASAGYFSALGIPLLYGRTFSAADRMGGPPVAIINQSLARELFGTENAVGRHITSCGPPVEPTEIVGIVGDVRAAGLAVDIRDQVHYASAQVTQRSMSLVVRAGIPVETLVPALRRTVNGLDPLLPISSPRTMEEVIDQTLATPKFQSTLLALLGASGLVLAVVGIYGVIGLLVIQRTQEFGIRIALGARRPQVLAMVVRQGLALAVVGIAIGVAASLVATRMLDELLFGIGPHDPITFGIVVGLIAIAAVAASAIPAWRAMRVDPLVAMRS